MKRIFIILFSLVLSFANLFAQEENVVLPANGGVLVSFTSELGGDRSAANLTDGITTDEGWSSIENPDRQEFIYSFRDGKFVVLTEVVLFSGTASGQYFCDSIEIWTSTDTVDYTLAASGNLENRVDTLTLELDSVIAQRVMLVILSGYDTLYRELGEFVLNGQVDDTPPVITLSGPDTVTVYYGEAYTEPGAVGMDNTDGDISNNIVITGNVNPFTVGSYSLTYNVSDQSGNAALTVHRYVNVIDTVPPAIVLTGPDTVKVYYGEAYSEAGANASDNADGDLSSDIIINGNVNSYIVGGYQLTYDVNDYSGNAAETVTRTVNVIDTVPPLVTLNGPDTVIVYYGETYTEAGASAIDNADGDLSGNIVINGSVDSFLVGSYLISYDVVDLSGNAALSVTRVVNVSDTVPPVITLNGSDTITYYAGDNYIEFGAVAFDNANGDISENIAILSTVDTTIEGSYYVEYSVEDSSGNLAVPVIRVVHVIDTLQHTLPLTFESGIFDITNFEGAYTTIIQNPQQEGINTSNTVAQLVKGFEQVWGGSSFLLPEPIDFSVNKGISIKVVAPRKGASVMMRIEHATNSGVFIERSLSVKAANEWDSLCFDFSAATSGVYSKIILVFDRGVTFERDSNYTYLIDDIEQAFILSNTDASLIDLQVNSNTVVNFSPNVFSYTQQLPEGTTQVPQVTAIARNEESTLLITPADTIPGTTEIVVTAEDNYSTSLYKVNFDVASESVLPIDFESEHYDITNFDGGFLSVIENPQVSELDSSVHVGEMIKGAGASWAGSYITLTSPIDFTNNPGISMKVFSPRAGARVLIKLEHLTDPGIFIQRELTTTGSNSWETLSYDFTGASSGIYSKVVIIFDFGTSGDGSANFTFLIDDIEQISSVQQSYSLTVNSGNGDGNYLANDTVSISASQAPPGQVFERWDILLGSPVLENIFASSTNLLMGASDIIVAAIYRPLLYTLNVNNGSGDGDYHVDSVVAIVADSAPAEQEFDSWQINFGGPVIDDILASSTFLTISASSATITATYRPISYELLVNSGSGTGIYEPATSVSISANPAPVGFEFDYWMIDSGHVAIADSTASTTSLVTSTTDASVTAVYRAILYSLIVNNGSGDGAFYTDSTVTIVADSAPANHEFDTWIINYGNPSMADTNSQATLLTMSAAGSMVTATYKPIVYSLTVIGGSGEGYYNSGEVVSISADTAPAGEEFDMWVILEGSPSIADIHSDSTVLTMFSDSAAVMATYRPIQYSLTVNNGSGNGNYESGTVVSISANQGPQGYEFDAWEIISGTPLLADTNAINTNLTMLSNDAVVTATYRPLSYDLIVNNGSGSGSYHAGETVDIVADSAPPGEVFDVWNVNSGGPSIANSSQSATSLVMSANSASITATYRLATYELIVNNGSGDGNYEAGKTITITSDPPALGYVFHYWRIDSGSVVIEDIYSSGTSLTTATGHAIVEAVYMPAQHWLTVNNGTGDGSYQAGTEVIIIADTAPQGLEFAAWVVNFGDPVIADINSPATTVVVPSGSATITATYKPIVYELLVLNGSGGGSYTSGETVAISANSAAQGNTFDRWVVNFGTPFIADIYSPQTSLTMRPDSANIAAVYKSIEYDLIVNNGSGSGNYVAGETTTISANTPPSGQEFYYWEVNSGNVIIDDIFSAITVLTIGDSSATITATYRNIQYELMVINGNGDGFYEAGDTISLVANTPLTGYEFVAWSVNTGGPLITDVNESTTTMIMPAGAVSITATYQQIAYALLVNNGSGGGNYVVGTQVTIIADNPPDGEEFYIWQIDSGNVSISNVNTSSTSLTMLSSPAIISAVYRPISYSLAVNFGSGDGYYENGTVVNISADTAPLGQEFDRWIINYGNPVISDIYSSNTTLVISESVATITATFKPIEYELIVENGEGDGFYISGQNILISADSAQDGFQFDSWIIEEGDASISDVYSSATVLTMSSEDARIRATYTLQTYELIVNSGNGDGYYISGTIVPIFADGIPAGYEFDRWVIEFGNPVINDSISENTFIVTSSGNSEVTATYKLKTSFNGSILTWADECPLSEQLVTEITPAGIHSPIVVPDANGLFVWDISNGTEINIVRDIPASTPVMNYINGYDAYLAAQVAVLDDEFLPNVYQILAMDVNRDGRVSAGDITQIAKRAVGQLDEFATDWLFIPSTTIKTNISYRISDTYPENDQQGYSRTKVPVVLDDIPIPVEDSSGLLIVDSELYKSVLLGDAGYVLTPDSSSFKSVNSESQILLDLNAVTASESIIEIPLYISSDIPVYSLDFSLSYNAAIMNFESIVDYAGIEEMVYENDGIINLSSYSLNAINTESHVLGLRFMCDNTFESIDFNFDISLLNGLQVLGNISDINTSITGNEKIPSAHRFIYPNPTSETLHVSFDGTKNVKVYDFYGQILKSYIDVNQSVNIDVTGFKDGNYILMIGNEVFQFVVVK